MLKTNRFGIDRIRSKTILGYKIKLDVLLEKVKKTKDGMGFYNKGKLIGIVYKPRGTLATFVFYSTGTVILTGVRNYDEKENAIKIFEKNIISIIGELRDK